MEYNNCREFQDSADGEGVCDMKTIKTFFSSFRNVVITVVCAAALAVLGTGIALAAGAGKNETIMDRNKALDHAFADAGVSSSDVTITKQKLEKENGRQYYDIEFFSGEYKYDYEIDAMTGAVTGVNIEALFDRPSEPLAASGAPADGDSPQGTGGSRREQDSQPDIPQSPQPAQDSQPGTSQPQQPARNGQKSRIDLEAARTAALSDAGVDAADAVFTESRLDWDDGVQVYDIEFHTLEAKYEYEVNAATGTIMSKEKEQLPGSQGGQPGTSRPQTPVQGDAGNTDAYIGMEQAKAAAAAHAGLDVSDVVFTKTKLEQEHGYAKYEIEFRKDRMEYEYAIDAFTGNILEHGCEYDD